MVSFKDGFTIIGTGLLYWLMKILTSLGCHPKPYKFFVSRYNRPAALKGLKKPKHFKIPSPFLISDNNSPSPTLLLLKRHFLHCKISQSQTVPFASYEPTVSCSSGRALAAGVPAYCTASPPPSVCSCSAAHCLHRSTICKLNNDSRYLIEWHTPRLLTY